MPLAAVLAFLKRYWPILAGIMLVVGLVVWHNAEVSKARREGAIAQATADREAYTKAETAATKRQLDLKAKTAAKAETISKGTDDALQHRYTDLARGYDDLRLRWEAYRADQGRTGQGGPAGPTSAASVSDGTYCPSQGWVSLDVASAAAEAADTAIAKDDAWRAWYEAQAEAWPK